MLSLLGIAAFESLLRVPTLYLEPGSNTDFWLFFSLMGVSWVLAAAWAFRQQLDLRLLPAWLLLAGVFCASSGVFWFEWLARPALAWLAYAYAIAGGAGIGVGCVVGASWLKLALQAALAERALTPVRLLLVSAGGIGLTAALGQIGPLRAGVVLGLLLATASWAALGTLTSLGQSAIAFAVPVQRACLSLLGIGLVGIWFLDGWVPREALGTYDNVVLLYRQSPRGDLAITAGERQFQVFTGGGLRVSSLDERRYFEALAHPALALAQQRAQVLIVGAGDGLAAREAFRYADVKEVWLIAENPALVELSRGVSWLTQQNERSLFDPRLRIIGEEASVWLTREPRRFDVILLDTQDPRDFVAGKYYTRFFLQTLRSRLNPGGILALQATSSRSGPAVIPNLIATCEAAGFTTLLYSAGVPTLGLWNFVLASPAASALAATPRELPPGVHTFDRASLNGLLLRARTETPKIPQGQVSLLHQQTILSAFLHGPPEP